MSEIQKGKNMLFAEENGEVVGKITYFPEGDIYTVDHTLVAEQKRGTGLGQELVQEMAALARKDGKKIRPVCTYVLAQFKRNPEYHDIWAKD